MKSLLAMTYSQAKWMLPRSCRFWWILLAIACSRAQWMLPRSCEVKWKVSWQWPTLPGGSPPSTIGVCELNFRVRDVTGCTLAAIVTKRQISNLSIIKLNNICRFGWKNTEFSASRRSPRSLVQISSMHCCTYTFCLSSRWSSCDLTILTIKVI